MNGLRRRAAALAAGTLFALAGLASPALPQEPADLLAELASRPLRPVDTSSPRATLQSFVTDLRAAAEVVLAGGSPKAAEALAFRAFRTLDVPGDDSADSTNRLSAVRRFGDGSLLLRILERVELPPWETVPDAAAVKAAGLDAWTIPDTEITIARVEDGPRAGEFLFSAATVARLPEFWERVRFLPVRAESRRIDLGLSTFQATSEWSAVRPVLTALPAPFFRPLFGMSLWKWLATVVVVGGGIALFALLIRLGRQWDQRHERPIARLGVPLACVAILATVPLLYQALADGVNAPPRYMVGLTGLLDFLFYGALAILAAAMVVRVGEALIRAREPRTGSIDASLIRLTYRVIAIVAVLYVAVLGAEQLGIPVAPLLAGLGVGGLAIALAVRPTLENVVGGFMLFADKPVRVGDFCLFGDKMGTVEEVGLRSTRLRGIDRTVITVPNAEFSQLQLVNFTRRDQMLYQVTIGLRYETTPDQLRHVMAKIREMLIRHERVAPEPARVRLSGFGASSLDIEIFAYVAMSDYNEYLGAREDLNLRIMQIVADSGTGFAFPSQTVYLARDGGLDAERGDAAADEVSAWRRERRLPFPEFDEAERAKMAGTLAYPPEGSPHARAIEAELFPPRGPAAGAEPG